MERKRMGEQQRARSRERLDSESDRSDRVRAPPLPLNPPSGYPGHPPAYSDNESVSSSKKTNLRKNGAVSRRVWLCKVSSDVGEQREKGGGRAPEKAIAEGERTAVCLSLAADQLIRTCHPGFREQREEVGTARQQEPGAEAGMRAEGQILFVSKHPFKRSMVQR
ncbi:hypothetical protein OJAV_G00163050 [Oryzias javanicus]|uniref:Uncharacterized protein n=1 Tax=Oryzias javanicus TaxID=123683 RepID=A0A437CK01_ORYJA|nr:hypothetical protein OJAV_G00163050 [Oryzias javanicus]